MDATQATVRQRGTAFWFSLVGIFLLALSVRLSCPASKYTVWYERSAAFWDALLSRNWAATYQSYHPGVTTTWIAGAGMELFLTARGRPPTDIAQLPGELPSPQGPAARAAVAALGVVTAGCIVLAYVLLLRSTNGTTAFVAGCFLALDPFYITHSKMIHVDALVSSLMLVSALFLLNYLRESKAVQLVASGVFGGLALLTKSPALFLIPYAGLVTTIAHVTGDDLRDLISPPAWRHGIGKIARTLTIWMLVAASVFCIVWPAMWVQPVKAISNMLMRGALHHAEQAHPFPQFFLGRTVRDPGVLYYPVTLAWKTTLVTLPGIGLAIWFLIRRRQTDASRTPWYVLAFAAAFLLQMTLSAKKTPRYVLPAFLALDVVAAWGIVQAIQKLQDRRAASASNAALVLTIGVLVIQAAVVFRVHPYYGTHHNLLLGGSRGARSVLQLGDQGEGLDLAARFLNQKPGAGFITAGLCDPGNLMFRENFAGVTKPINHSPVDYRVFFVNDLQRSVRFAHCKEYWEACEEDGPIWSATFDHVPYVWICRAYPQDLDSFAVDRQMNVHVGEHIDLLGYDIGSRALSSSDPLTVTLFWRSNGQVTADNHVFVHLQDTDGDLIAQDDGVPGGGKRPTWGWQEQEIIPDEHVIAPLRAVPAGTYTLSVGMYDYATKARLAATEADGSALPAGRIPLLDLELHSQ